jgi:RNA polymerase sigma factor (sigma-70 family)
MYTYAIYLGFNEYEVMDAIHDVFCHLCEKEINIQYVSTPKYYLFNALRNRLIDISRKSLEEISFNSFSNIEFLFSELKENKESKLITEEEEVIIKQKINEMLSILSPRQQEIIYLRYIQECDYKQISEIMKIDYENCRKLVYKAIQVLRKNFSIPLIPFIHFIFFVK